MVDKKKIDLVILECSLVAADRKISDLLLERNEMMLWDTEERQKKGIELLDWMARRDLLSKAVRVMTEEALRVQPPKIPGV